MKKDFKSWHENKSNIQEAKERPFFHEREIWFVSIGLNIGFEEDGKGETFLRPVIILKKFNNESFWGEPITRRLKNNQYYFPFKMGERGMNSLILSQLRLMDAKRLHYKIKVMDHKEYEKVKQKLKDLIP